MNIYDALSQLNIEAESNATILKNNNMICSFWHLQKDFDLNGFLELMPEETFFTLWSLGKKIFLSLEIKEKSNLNNKHLLDLAFKTYVHNVKGLQPLTEKETNNLIKNSFLKRKLLSCRFDAPQICDSDITLTGDYVFSVFKNNQKELIKTIEKKIVSLEKEKQKMKDHPVDFRYLAQLKDNIELYNAMKNNQTQAFSLSVFALKINDNLWKTRDDLDIGKIFLGQQKNHFETFCHSQSVKALIETLNLT